jgi:hypothetical protein
MGGVGKKKYITNLGCEKYFLQGHILSTAGAALRMQASKLKLERAAKS